MPQGGLLRVRIVEPTASESDGIRIEIEDQGTGIRPEHLPKVFEPFFTTKPNVGTGIGLWVTRQLVESRGGRISVTSKPEPPDSDTKIVIDIPFEDPHHANRKI
jgi:signal transduction histidine kinase